MNEIRTGNVSIQTVELLRDYTETPVSLNHIFLEMNIYEDIYSDSLSGNILVADTNNIISNYPVRGGEFIRVTMRDHLNDTVIDKLFRIYEISERNQVNRGQIIYIINFMSVEKIMNSDFKISQAYPKTTTSEIVKNVWKQFVEYYNSKHSVYYPNSHLPEADMNFVNSLSGGENVEVSVDENSSDIEVFSNNNMFNIDIQSTKYIADYIIPNWCVYSTIHWLAARSIGVVAKGASFLFFETLEGFKFVSLETLFEIGKNLVENDRSLVYNFTGIPSTTEEIRQQYGNKIITSVNVVQSPNVVENIQRGMYSSKMIYHDLVERNYEVVEYDYRQSYQDDLNYKHTYRNVYPHVHLNEEPLSRMDVAINNYDSDSYIFYQPKSDNYPDLWKQSRISQLQQIENVKLELTTEGHMNINVGKVVEVNLGDVRSGVSGLDPLYSGYYLVTGLRHKIDQNKYELVMEVAKDSF